jgi:hypothetical protein
MIRKNCRTSEASAQFAEKKGYFTNELHANFFWRPLLNALVFPFICVHKKLFFNANAYRYGIFLSFWTDSKNTYVFHERK